MNESIVKIAASLRPLMKYLYSKGIIDVSAYDNSVHTTREFFKETFPVYETEELPDRTYFIYYFEGIKFFSIEFKGES